MEEVFDPEIPAPSEKYIYHYTTAETFLAQICKVGGFQNLHYSMNLKAEDHQHHLRFSRFVNSNDPFEFQAWDPMGIKWSGDVNDHHDTIAKVICEGIEIKKRSYFLPFCLDKEPKIDVENANDHVDEMAYRGFADSRMWAQYGAKHTGVCIVLERQALIEEVEKLREKVQGLVHKHKRVKYVNRISLPSIDGNKYAKQGELYTNALVENEDVFLFTKHRDWEHENEYRFVLIPHKTTEDLFVDIRGSVRGVICGARFQFGSVLNIPFLQETYGRVYKMYWKSGRRSCF